MGKITAYRCDVCKSIVEHPKFNIVKYPECDFKLGKFRNYAPEDVACSDDCARAALLAWIEERENPIPKEKEDGEQNSKGEPMRDGYQPHEIASIKFAGAQPQ